jgi:gamma-glutamylcyclotransferase (GGCT)/AIG2-like uncharacterized protein YtfP
MASVRLFVYGSLKRAGRHHKELNSKRAVFLGEVETRPGYRLEPLRLEETDGPGEYLALVDDEQGRGANREPDLEPQAQTNSVKGELFELDESELPALDAFEGGAYVRGEVRLLPAEGAAQKRLDKALAYFKKAR